MNKAKLAQQVDRTLKDAGYSKAVIKGIGWKGRGQAYLANGFVIDLSDKCVVLSHHVESAIPVTMLLRDESQLSDSGKAHAKRIRDRVENAINRYKSSLSSFCFDERIDRVGLPYLVITGNAPNTACSRTFPAAPVEQKS